MTPNRLVFTIVPPELESVFQELRQREPIFHTAAFGSTPDEFERVTAPDYWEIGASGRLYSRAFILEHLKRVPPVDAAAAGWTCSDFGLRRLGSEVYWITYTLRQNDRVTRRSTLWEKTSDGWRVLFHQGTIVTGDDDTVPC